MGHDRYLPYGGIVVKGLDDVRDQLHDVGLEGVPERVTLQGCKLKPAR